MNNFKNKFKIQKVFTDRIVNSYNNINKYIIGNPMFFAL